MNQQNFVFSSKGDNLFKELGCCGSRAIGIIENREFAFVQLHLECHQLFHYIRHHWH